MLRRGPGLMSMMAHTAVIAGTATVTVKAVSGAMGGSSQKQAAAEQQTAPTQQLAETQQQQPALAAQAAAPGGESLDEQLVQIQKLSVMKDQGVLTEEEFQTKKRQILGI